MDEGENGMSDKHIAIYEYNGYAVLKKIAKNRHRTMEEAKARLQWHIDHTNKYYDYNRQFVIVDLNIGKIIEMVEECNEIDE
jgi:hypothetical protein